MDDRKIKRSKGRLWAEVALSMFRGQPKRLKAQTPKRSTGPFRARRKPRLSADLLMARDVHHGVGGQGHTQRRRLLVVCAGFTGFPSADCTQRHGQTRLLALASNHRAVHLARNWGIGVKPCFVMIRGKLIIGNCAPIYQGVGKLSNIRPMLAFLRT